MAYSSRGERYSYTVVIPVRIGIGRPLKITNHTVSDWLCITGTVQPVGWLNDGRSMNSSFAILLVLIHYEYFENSLNDKSHTQALVTQRGKSAYLTSRKPSVRPGPGVPIMQLVGRVILLVSYAGQTGCDSPSCYQ